MKTHDLKCHPEPFAAVCRGEKLHEVRVNDRDYQSGDRVVLREWRPDPLRDLYGKPTGGEYTGLMRVATIGHVTCGPHWGLSPGLCVFSLLNVEAAR